MKLTKLNKCVAIRPLLVLIQKSIKQIYFFCFLNQTIGQKHPNYGICVLFLKLLKLYNRLTVLLFDALVKDDGKKLKKIK